MFHRMMALTTRLSAEARNARPAKAAVRQPAQVHRAVGICGCEELDGEQRRAAALELSTERMTLRQTFGEPLSDGFA
jgi:hypothetical protein